MPRPWWSLSLTLFLKKRKKEKGREKSPKNLKFWTFALTWMVWPYRWCNPSFPITLLDLMRSPTKPHSAETVSWLANRLCQRKCLSYQLKSQPPTAPKGRTTLLCSWHNREDAGKWRRLDLHTQWPPQLRRENSQGFLPGSSIPQKNRNPHLMGLDRKREGGRRRDRKEGG